MHNFLIKELGRAVPYRVYDLAADHGWVSVGMDHDTAAFTAAEREELARLRRENTQLREDREILSKAAAWFAPESGTSKRSSGS